MDTTSPPTGTVTLLFTDIEGSTRLWEWKPGTMQEALARLGGRDLVRGTEAIPLFVDGAEAVLPGTHGRERLRRPVPRTRYGNG